MSNSDEAFVPVSGRVIWDCREAWEDISDCDSDSEVLTDSDILTDADTDWLADTDSDILTDSDNDWH